MKKIVVSIHDITSRFASETDEILHRLDELGVSEKSILIVPEFAGNFLITDDPDFIALMNKEKQKGAELGLHGLVHQNFEFFRHDYNSALKALKRGRDLFEQAFGFPPNGFVAPQWFQSKGSLKAIDELGFLYTAVFRTLRYSNGTVYKTFPYNFDWGNSLLDKVITALNSWVSSFRNTGLLRFAIHPMDIPNGVFDKEMDILSNLLKNGWEPITYEKLNNI